MDDKLGKCRVFVRVITPEGRTLDALGECDTIELDEVAITERRKKDKYSALIEPIARRLGFKPNLAVIAWRMMGEIVADRQLVGDQLPTKDELIFGVSHRA